MTVARARKIQRFLSQPFHVAEVFTGSPGESRAACPPFCCCGGCQLILEIVTTHPPNGQFMTTNLTLGRLWLAGG